MGEDNWDTIHEKAFITRLGLHNIYGGPTSGYMRSERYHEKRIRCLNGYLTSARLRTNWGKIDPIKCVLHAEYCIVRELGLYKDLMRNKDAKEHE